MAGKPQFGVRGAGTAAGDGSGQVGSTCCGPGCPTPPRTAEIDGKFHFLVEIGQDSSS